MRNGHVMLIVIGRSHSIGPMLPLMMMGGRVRMWIRMMMITSRKGWWRHSIAGKTHTSGRRRGTIIWTIGIGNSGISMVLFAGGALEVGWSVLAREVPLSRRVRRSIRT